MGIFARGCLGDGDEVVDLGLGGLGAVERHDRLLCELSHSHFFIKIANRYVII